MNSTKATLTKILTFILVAYAANTFNLGPRFAPWEYDVSGKTFAEYYKAIDFYMGKRVPVVLSFMAFQLLFLLFLGLPWKNRSEWSFHCVALALVIQIATTIVLINTNHAEMNDWDPAHLPANWQTVRH